MERALKRQRIGPPLGANDDDDDELNSRPEDVNLRRDPGYQLQKKRSFAAFKLKSRFESIFEKYEKDFTDIGDEILLSTGEIAVNNGHLESLKDQTFDGDDEEADIEEEERILQGNHDNRLSTLAQKPMPLTIQPRPPVFPAQWQPTSHLMGGPPMLSGAMYPGQMPFGNFGAFPPPMSQSFDPAWNAPALPMATFGSAFGPTAPRVKSKQLLIAPANADDEDDILLGVATVREKPVRVSRPPAETRLLEDKPSEKEQLPGSSEPRPKQVIKQATKQPSEPSKKAGPGRKRVPKPALDLSSPAKSSPTPKPTNQRLQVEIRAMKPFDTSSYMIITPDPTPEAEPTPATSPVNSEVPTPKANSEVAVCPGADAMDVEKALPSPPPPAAKDVEVAPSPAEPKKGGSKQKAQCPSPPAEVFSRNLMDTSYEFSDEDEPTLPRARFERQNPAPATSGLGPRPGALKKRRRNVKKPASAMKPSTLETISEDTDDAVIPEEVGETETEQDLGLMVEDHDAVIPEEPEPDMSLTIEDHDTSMSEEVAEMEPEQDMSLTIEDHETALPEEVAEEEPEQDMSIMVEDHDNPTVDAPELHIPSPTTSDRAFPPTSSPTRSRDKRRAAGNTPPIPEPVEPSSDLIPSSPSISQQDHPDIVPDQELPTERRKRKRSPSSPEPTKKPSPRPIPFSSPGRIPRDHVVPETPGATSSPSIPRPSPRPREPSPDLGFRDPSPVIVPGTATLTINPKPLTLNPKHPPPKTPSRRGSASILSLLPLDPTNTDTDADELAPSPSAFTPRARAHTPRTRTSVSKTGASVRSLRTPRNKKRFENLRFAATVGRSGGLLMRDRIRRERERDRGGVVSSPAPSRGQLVGDEVIRTPGGTRRRCGEGGFRCDRDFCFVCL